MKFWFKSVLGLVAVISLVTVAVQVHAQTASPTPVPKNEAGLSFPIPELGSCADMGSCLKYCDDPVHGTSCVAYAKEKGFYKDDVVVAAPDEFWNKAKAALGCDSRESCESVCQDEANQSKCHEFAVKQDLVGGYVIDPQKEAVLAAAKTALGCDGAKTCLDFCADAAHAKECSGFANQVGLRGGEEAAGPGGCSSPDTCHSFCSDPGNYGQCSKFLEAEGSSFRGPGGCGDQQSCRSYCESNPIQCRTYAPGSNGVYVPVTCPAGQNIGPDGACTAADLTEKAGACDQAGEFWDGTSCQKTPPPGILASEGTPYFEPRDDMGGCKTPAECYDFCSSNAASCPGFDTKEKPRPPETFVPNVYVTPGTPVKFEARKELGGCDSPGSCYDYCKTNPAACSGFNKDSPRPLDVYVPGVYNTPPSNYPYFTPSDIAFYVTPFYPTPPEGSNYTTPSYYTPGTYSTPHYFTPSGGGNYVTPNYYTPGQNYPTPADGNYPTPTYPTPRYYTPPLFSNYTTPTYYTPPIYVTPTYYTPGFGSNYTTPTYVTPPQYTTPEYITPSGSLLGVRYITPSYYTPLVGSNYTTPNYPSPPYYTPGGYYTPAYLTPSGNGQQYSTPVYYSPGSGYATPQYYTPGQGSNYTTPNYPTPQYYSPVYTSPTYYTPPAGSSYTTPTYYTPPIYVTPTYYTPPAGSNYTSPPYYSPSTSATSASYNTPSYYSPGVPYNTPGSNGAYGTPAYYSPTSTSYSSPAGGPNYSSPTSSTYTAPSANYPSPSDYLRAGAPYASPPASGSYPTPSYSSPPAPGSYPTPSYSSPPSGSSYSSPVSYPSPSSYSSPSYYATPYNTPDYSSPYSSPEYSTPSGEVHGAASDSFFYRFLRLLGLSE